MSSTLSFPRLAGDPVCVVDARAALGEGTWWSVAAQALWWVDILGRRLHRLRPADGACASWQFETEISTVAERANGPGLIVTLRHAWALFDPDAADAAPRLLHRPADEPASNRFNDGKCDRAGRFWAGTMDFDCVARTGSLYRYDGGGGCSRHALGWAVTNGPTWSADERTMYLNDTVRGRVFAFDFDAAAGVPSGQREWLRLARGDGFPDGMTTDAAGRIWIAHWGGNCVSCHDPDSGAELGRVALPASQVTDCAFGGPDLRTLYVTTARDGLDDGRLAAEPLAGGLFAVGVAEPGVAPSRFAG